LLERWTILVPPRMRLVRIDLDQLPPLDLHPALDCGGLRANREIADLIFRTDPDIPCIPHCLLSWIMCKTLLAFEQGRERTIELDAIDVLTLNENSLHRDLDDPLSLKGRQTGP